MKQNRNRSRDLGFYMILLAILVAVIMLMTRQQTPDQIKNYSDLVSIFQEKRVESFHFVPDSNGGTIVLQVRDKTPSSPDDESPNATTEMTYDLYSFSVFYEDFHELIQEQYEEHYIKEYEYEPGGSIPWWVSFIP